MAGADGAGARSSVHAIWTEMCVSHGAEYRIGHQSYRAAHLSSGAQLRASHRPDPRLPVVR